MKKLLLFLLISVGLNAQFNYQAIVKDSDGNPVTNNQVKFKFSLIYQSATASPVFVEEHELVTPPDGVVNLSVGEGTVVNGTFSNIDWSQSVFMKEELDTGSGYQDMGTRKVASVPVAEFSKKTSITTGTFIDNYWDRNLFIGDVAIFDTIYNSHLGRYNIGIGSYNTFKLGGGDGNIIIGDIAMEFAQNSDDNIAIGVSSLGVVEETNLTIAIGQQAGENVSGANNLILGNYTHYYSEDDHEYHDPTPYNEIYRAYLPPINVNKSVFLGDYSLVLPPEGQTIENSVALGYKAIVTASNTIQLGNVSVTLVNTSGVVSASGFIGSGDEVTLTYSGTVTNVLAVINDLKSQIDQLNTISEGDLSGLANIKTYKGRAFQTNIVTQTSIFTVSYNEVYEQPNWIEYQVRNVTANVERSGDFYGIEGIYTSHEDDYHNNDWDKGHLAPAASFLDSQENLEATFSYLNCALMKDNLNRYEWAQLEGQVRDWASGLGVDIDVRIDLFFDENHTVLNTGAHVPSRFLKTITLPAGTTFPNETISKKCFEFPNADTNGVDWTDFEVDCSP